jgi:hypothetical protein
LIFGEEEGSAMPEINQEEQKISLSDIIIEALKGIKSEILLYAIVVAALIIGSAALGLEVLREVKWPLIIIFTLALFAYFFARAVPKAKLNLKKRVAEKKP